MNALGKQNKNRRECLKQLGAVCIGGYALPSHTMAMFVGDSQKNVSDKN